MVVNLSSYAAGLPKDTKDRNIQKISLINDVDPFLGTFPGAETVSKLPREDTSDTFSYLVLKIRPLYFRCKFYTDFLLCRFDILKG